MPPFLQRLRLRFPRAAAWLDRYGQPTLNAYVALNVLIYLGWEAWRRASGREAWSVADVAFFAQTGLMATLLLIRVRHRAVDWSARQLVAVAAFYSGAPLLLYPGVPFPGWIGALGGGLALAANVLGIVCLLNLGRSFGILIALRRVRTGGLYAWMRHPMYASDLLLRIGYAVARPSAWTLGWTLAGIALYWTRAVMEERFLAQDPEYADYLRRVRWRFLPFAGWSAARPTVDSKE